MSAHDIESGEEGQRNRHEEAEDERDGKEDYARNAERAGHGLGRCWGR